MREIVGDAVVSCGRLWLVENILCGEHQLLPLRGITYFTTSYRSPRVLALEQETRHENAWCQVLARRPGATPEYSQADGENISRRVHENLDIQVPRPRRPSPKESTHGVRHIYSNQCPGAGSSSFHQPPCPVSIHTYLLHERIVLHRRSRLAECELAREVVKIWCHS